LAAGKSAVFKTWPIPVGEGGFAGENPKNFASNIVPDIVLKIGPHQPARDLPGMLAGCFVGTLNQLLIVTNHFPMPTELDWNYTS